MNATTSALKTAAEEAATSLRASGILGTVTGNTRGQVMYHMDHEFLDSSAPGIRRPQAEADRIAWEAMIGLTAYGVAWANEDMDVAHDQLAMGGVIILEWDGEE